MTNEPSQATVRRANSDDAVALSDLSAVTFTATFGHLYPAEDLQTFLTRAHSVDAWTRSLTDPHKAAWIALLPDTTPVGFLVAGTCKLPVQDREATAGEVQRLYVIAHHQNLHLGSRLMDLGLEWLEAQHLSPIYIGVWSENIGAQRFYGRYGFTKVGEYGFPVGKTVDREFILKRPT